MGCPAPERERRSVFVSLVENTLLPPVQSGAIVAPPAFAGETKVSRGPQVAQADLHIAPFGNLARFPEFLLRDSLLVPFADRTESQSARRMASRKRNLAAVVPRVPQGAFI